MGHVWRGLVQKLDHCSKEQSLLPLGSGYRVSSSRCVQSHLLQSWQNCPIFLARTYLSLPQTLLDWQRGRHVSCISRVLKKRGVHAAVVKSWVQALWPLLAFSFSHVFSQCQQQYGLQMKREETAESERVQFCVCIFSVRLLRALFNLWHNAASVEKILGTKNKLKDSGAGSQNY